LAQLPPGRHRDAPVVIVGAGPIGLAMAIDLAQHGIRSVLVDEDDTVSTGSRAICWAKRTLEIFDRLGVGDRVVAKGVTWKIGRLFHRDREIYSFDLLPQEGHERPAFVNLQQYYVEQYLIDRAHELGELIDLCWRHRVVAMRQHSDGVTLELDTPAGPATLEATYLLACDGARSTVRRLMALPFEGETFEERFLIADVKMRADFPAERWFWFEPPFHAGQSTLLHKQPDGVWRIDFQLGPDADPEEETRPERVRPRIEAMLGHCDFELEWVSLYRFRCCRLARFVHDRVIFVGDSAHLVSPFGARGGNGGIHDVDNLGWKLAAVLKGAAPPSLLATYDEERGRGADENIANSARATRFMTPKSAAEKLFRDEVLDLARTYPFARMLVNSGRLSVPCSLAGLSLQTAPADARVDLPAPGQACPDAPVAAANGGPGWLLRHLGGGFVLMTVGDAPLPAVAGVHALRIREAGVAAADVLVDTTGRVAERYGVGPVYLIRPDQHVAARFERPDRSAVEAARARALGRSAAEVSLAGA